MKLDFIRTAASAIWFLGLMSCQSDKTPHAADSWLVQAPVIENARAAKKTMMFSGVTEDADSYEIDANLVFPSLQNDAQNGLHFQIKALSTCHQGSQPNVFKESRFTDLARLPMTSLLSEEIWTHLDETQSLVCDFHFEATNPLGSKRVLDVPQISFTQLGRLENWSISSSNKDLTGEHVSSPDELRNLNTTELVNSSGTLRLSCDHFENERSFQGLVAKDIPSVMQDLILGEKLPKTEIATNDPRLTQTRQNCRLLFVRNKSSSLSSPQSAPEDTSNAEHFLSAKFQLQFPISNPGVTFIKGLSHWMRADSINSFDLFTVKIENPLPVAIGMKLSHPNQDIGFAPVIFRPLDKNVGDTESAHHASIALHFDSEVRSWKAGDEITFEIPAKRSVQLSWRAQTQSLCYYMNIIEHPDMPRGPKDTLNGGYIATLSVPIALQRLVNWDPARPGGGAIVDLSTPLSSAPQLAIWLPSRSSTLYGLEGNPPPTLVTHRLTTSGQLCGD